jgi:hypothetical protein
MRISGVAPVIPVTFTLNRIVELLSSSNVAEPVAVHYRPSVDVFFGPRAAAGP